MRINNIEWKEQLYRRYCKDSQLAEIRFIPYGMWGNRGEKEKPQEMQVWFLFVNDKKSLVSNIDKKYLVFVKKSQYCALIIKAVRLLF